MSDSSHAFSATERAAVYRAIAERRDMRHFSGGSVAPELLARLLEAAHQAPSVGLMQPWRFIRITEPALRRVFGRRTLPQMDLASLACAIQNLWLASRAEGLGMGWVSLFDPAALGELLGLPPGSEAVAVLCLGPVAEFYPAPMLALEGWSEPRPLAELVYQNRWGERA
ncbi:5,6-dimethylbenzimidazole synthase [Pseudomonas aeruginosa]|nr:5,6-dimethylbenzimidazole synthase [Pseudomonas aeruginosa]